MLTVGVALVVADVVALRVAEQRLAERVQESSGLEEVPSVEVHGRPFLLQALRGRYDHIVVRWVDVPTGQLRFASLESDLRGARVPLRDALDADQEPVPVDELSTRAVVTYEELTSTVADRGLRVVGAEDGLVRVTGSIEVLGRMLEATAVSRPALEDGQIVVTAERFEVGNELADSLLSRSLGNRLDFEVPLEELPYDLALASLRADPDGIVLTANATNAVITPR